MIRGLKWLPVLPLLWLGGFLHFAAGLPRGEPAIETGADAIVVLTGGAQRLDAGLALLRAEKAKRLFVSGVNADVSKPMMPAYAANADLFECCVELGYRAADTAGNALEVAGWAGQNGATRLIVVTAAYHMPRALVELRRRLAGADIVPWPVFPAGGEIERWWRAPGTTVLLAVEFSKYLAALARARATGTMS